ncbi:MAG: hypothetical protein IID41_05665 [Planctomycetes bacterium]|nr:hypothetical protein [Planctomycetota bacterium]
MLFKTKLVLASAAVSVLFVFMFVSRNLRAEHAGDAESRAIDLDNTERSAAEPSNGEPSSSAQRRAMAENPSCTPQAGPCDQANGTPGCDDSACCNSVCDLDPYCCDVAWDELCAGPNEIVPGASCVERFNGPGQPCETAGVGMPDIIVVGIGGHSGANYEEYGVVGDIAAFSSGTTACNMGTAEAEWLSEGAGEGTTNRHPLIAQNMYRLSPNGKQFEMIGMSWLKHSFCAVNEFCNFCQFTNCSTLGIGCADTYTANRNGTTALGPRRDINPLGMDLDGTGPGTHAHPYVHPAGDETIRGRIQVHTADLGQPGAVYFVEVHYVTHDEPLALRGNNVSWVEVQMPSTSPFTDPMVNAGPEAQEQSALHAWQASDSGVVITPVYDADGGLLEVAYRVTLNPPDGSGTFTWHYEYAVHNSHSHRAARSFRVAVPSDVTLSNVGFHDVDYHSGDGHPSAGGNNFDGTDWTATLANGFVEWQMDFGSEINNANALRWGTTYNFRFDADTSPTEGPAELVHYRDAEGTPPANDVLAVAVLGPSSVLPGCGDLICDVGEDCETCPSDCANIGPGCGNGSCEPALGEDCLSCSADCRGQQNGEPNHQYCCGDGAGQNPIGCDDGRCSGGGFQCSDVPAEASCCGNGVCEGIEDEFNCAVDCLEPCLVDADCDDSDNCTVDACSADGACEHTPVACGPADDCCGSGCNADNDPDCTPCLPKSSACTANSDCCSNKCNNGSCRGS